MSIEENKAMMHRSLEVFNKGNLDLIDELYSKNYLSHAPATAREINGPEAMKQYVSELRSAFPDLNITIDDTIAEGEKIVSLQTLTGTHKGEFNGIPPTGKKFSLKSAIVNKIVNGKFVETWVYMDSLDLMQQLGIIQMPPA